MVQITELALSTQTPERKHIQDKPSDEAIRSNYLDQSEADRSRVRGWLEAKGFKTSIVYEKTGEDEYQGPDQPRIKVEWNNQAQDFEILNELLFLIFENGDLNDEEFNEQVVPQIEEIALKSQLFSGLNDDTIQRSSAHTDNPFRHTIKVLTGLKTSHLERLQVCLIRFETLCHDIGKLFIADQDYFQDHAYISYLIFGEFLRANGAPAHVVEELGAGIRCHHMLELVERNILSPEEANHIIKHKLQKITELGVIAVADALSVPVYKKFALMSGIEAVKLLAARIEEISRDLTPYLATFVHSLLVIADELGEAFNVNIRELAAFKKMEAFLGQALIGSSYDTGTIYAT